MFLVCSMEAMTDRPASWRMPAPKQMDKLASLVRINGPQKPGLDPEADLPQEYWQAILDDPRAESRSGPSRAALRLSQIPQHVLRVECRRCARTVEIQKVDAVRLYGRGVLEGCRTAAPGRYLHAADWAPRGRRLLAHVRVIAGAAGIGRCYGTEASPDAPQRGRPKGALQGIGESAHDDDDSGCPVFRCPRQGRGSHPAGRQATLRILERKDVGRRRAGRPVANRRPGDQRSLLLA